MEILKSFRSVIIIVLIVLVLVIIRSAGINHFRGNAKQWAEPSFTQANQITFDKVRSLTGKKLTVNLDNSMIPGYEITGDLMNISPDSILNKNIIKSIIRHNGPVLVYSSQPGLSARIWMVLSQMGCKKIFILTDSTDNEVLKYKFRRDSLSGLG